MADGIKRQHGDSGQSLLASILVNTDQVDGTTGATLKGLRFFTAAEGATPLTLEERKSFMQSLNIRDTIAEEFLAQVVVKNAAGKFGILYVIDTP